MSGSNIFEAILRVHLFFPPCPLLLQGHPCQPRCRNSRPHHLHCQDPSLCLHHPPLDDSVVITAFSFGPRRYGCHDNASLIVVWYDDDRYHHGCRPGQ